MKEKRTPSVGLVVTLLAAVCLLTGCSAHSSNVSKGGSNPSHTASGEGGHSTNISKQRTHATADTKAGGDGSGNNSEAEYTDKERSAANEGRLIRLTHLGGASYPVFSPDGKKIAFTNYTGGMKVSHGVAMLQGSTELYVMDADGSDLSRITPSGTAYAGGSQCSFSPDGKKIAYAATNKLGDGQIYVADISGANSHSITRKDLNANTPSWSPDGTKIAFAASPNASAKMPLGNGEIYVTGAHGANPKNLTKTPPTTYESSPSYSPDGKKILFASRFTNKGNTETVYVMDADGTNPTRLLSSYASDRYPRLSGSAARYSPDGNRIAFEGVFEGSSGGFVPGSFVMNADGTNPIKFGDERSTGLGGAVFFPNSARIAISHHTKGGTDEIYAVDIDGTNQSILSNHDSSNDSFPTLSPQSNEMAFMRQSYDDSGEFVSEIYLIRLKAGGLFP